MMQHIGTLLIAQLIYTPHAAKILKFLFFPSAMDWHRDAMFSLVFNKKNFQYKPQSKFSFENLITYGNI